MKLIGVTGGVGCGKSEVLRYIETNYNCRIEFSDEIARALEAPGGAIYESLIRLLEQYPADGGTGQKAADQVRTKYRRNSGNDQTGNMYGD